MKLSETKQLSYGKKIKIKNGHPQTKEHEIKRPGKLNLLRAPPNQR